MTGAFREVSRILKPSAYATLQFNNSNDEVWCAIQDALIDTGLEVRHAIGLDKIHPSIKGVKGLQAKENVASLDALIELRRRPSTRVVANRESASGDQIRPALIEFSRAQETPFTTDEAFASLIRSSLKEGSSLNGLSMQAVKVLCSQLFMESGTKWVAHENTTSLEQGSAPQFDDVAFCVSLATVLATTSAAVSRLI